MHDFSFLTAIRTTGRVQITCPEDLSLPPIELFEAELQELDNQRRLEMAYVPPEVNFPVAVWASSMLYHACRFLAYRDIGAATIMQTLATACPKPPSARTCYSVDLALCYLPNVAAMARGIAADDPLTAGLMVLAAQWPLSSVGIKGLPDEPKLDIAAFINHPSLRELYLDRIFQSKDLTRLGHPAVQDAAPEALGMFPELAPEVSTFLKPKEHV